MNWRSLSYVDEDFPLESPTFRNIDTDCKFCRRQDKEEEERTTVFNVGNIGDEMYRNIRIEDDVESVIAPKRPELRPTHLAHLPGSNINQFQDFPVHFSSNIEKEAVEDKEAAQIRRQTLSRIMARDKHFTLWGYIKSYWYYLLSLLIVIIALIVAIVLYMKCGKSPQSAELDGYSVKRYPYPGKENESIDLNMTWHKELGGSLEPLQLPQELGGNLSSLELLPALSDAIGSMSPVSKQAEPANRTTIPPARSTTTLPPPTTTTAGTTPDDRTSTQVVTKPVAGGRVTTQSALDTPAYLGSAVGPTGTSSTSRTAANDLAEDSGDNSNIIFTSRDDALFFPTESIESLTRPPATRRPGPYFPIASLEDDQVQVVKLEDSSKEDGLESNPKMNKMDEGESIVDEDDRLHDEDDRLYDEDDRLHQYEVNEPCEVGSDLDCQGNVDEDPVQNDVKPETEYELDYDDQGSDLQEPQGGVSTMPFKLKALEDDDSSGDYVDPVDGRIVRRRNNQNREPRTNIRRGTSRQKKPEEKFPLSCLVPLVSIVVSSVVLFILIILIVFSVGQMME